VDDNQSFKKRLNAVAAILFRRVDAKEQVIAHINGLYLRRGHTQVNLEEFELLAVKRGRGKRYTGQGNSYTPCPPDREQGFDFGPAHAWGSAHALVRLFLGGVARASEVARLPESFQPEYDGSRAADARNERYCGEDKLCFCGLGVSATRLTVSAAREISMTLVKSQLTRTREFPSHLVAIGSPSVYALGEGRSIQKLHSYDVVSHCV
jgi:hypothetical protein